VHDALVTGTAAEVAREAFPYLLVSRARVVAQEGCHRNDEPGRAEPALQPVGLPERLLDGGQTSIDGRQALDGGDLRSLSLDGEEQAGPHCFAVEEDGAGAAHPVLTAEMGASEGAVLTKEVGQRLPRLDQRPP